MSWKLIHRSGEVFLADFAPLAKEDLLQLKKRDGWSRGFSWKEYLRSENEYTAYKLNVVNDRRIQGLLAIAIRARFVDLQLVEKGPHNRKPNSEFINVAAVLFGYACLTSMISGGDGYVSMQAKSGLMQHYIQQYRMQVVDNKKRILIIPDVEARRLIELYFI